MDQSGCGESGFHGSSKRLREARSGRGGESGRGRSRRRRGGGLRRPEGQEWGQRRMREAGAGVQGRSSGQQLSKGEKGQDGRHGDPHLPSARRQQGRGSRDQAIPSIPSRIPVTNFLGFPGLGSSPEGSLGIPALEDKIWLPTGFFPPWKQVSSHWPTGPSCPLEHPSGARE